MTQKEMLQEAYTSNPKIWEIVVDVDKECEAEILAIVEQVIATVWYKL